MATQHREVADVLSLLGDQEPYWQRLRFILELIVLDIGPETSHDGKRTNALVEHGLASKDDVVAFGASAHDHRVLGFDALHAVRSTEKMPANTMTLRDAQAFVIRTVDNWIRQKESANAPAN